MRTVRFYWQVARVCWARLPDHSSTTQRRGGPSRSGSARGRTAGYLAPLRAVGGDASFWACRDHHHGGCDKLVVSDCWKGQCLVQMNRSE
jgi:hypothetical protein